MRPSLNFIHPFIYPTLSSADGRTRVPQAALRVERGKGEKYSCLPSSVPLSARLFTSLAPVYYKWKIKAGIWRQEHLNVWNRSCSNSQKWTVFCHEVLQTDKICYYRDSFDRSTASLKVPLMSINKHFYRNLYTFLRTLAKKIIKLIETSSFYDHSNSNKSARSSPRRLATVRLLRFGRTGREWVSDVIPGTCSHSDSENCLRE